MEYPWSPRGEAASRYSTPIRWPSRCPRGGAAHHLRWSDQRGIPRARRARGPGRADHGGLSPRRRGRACERRRRAPHHRSLRPQLRAARCDSPSRGQGLRLADSGRGGVEPDGGRRPGARHPLPPERGGSVDGRLLPHGGRHRRPRRPRPLQGGSGLPRSLLPLLGAGGRFQRDRDARRAGAARGRAAPARRHSLRDEDWGNVERIAGEVGVDLEALRDGT